MKSENTGSSVDRAAGYLNSALAGVVIFQAYLYLDCLGSGFLFSLGSAWQNALYLLSLIMLIGIVCLRQLYHKQMTRRAETGHEQLAAMVNMLSTVKHKLNNDMQVVLGNAELAEILINSGGNVTKPVQNISAAANDAIERIEQLSVFGSSGCTNPKPIDLNATLRESMARLATEMPSSVNLRLELNPLSSRVIADRYLLSLSLSHLVRQASLSMCHGGEIVVRTLEKNSLKSNDRSFIVAEIYFSQAIDHSLSQAEEGAHADEVGRANSPISTDSDALQVGMSTTKVIVERSGVQSVRLSRANNESLFAMRFSTSAQAQSDSATGKLLVSQLMN